MQEMIIHINTRELLNNIEHNGSLYCTTLLSHSLSVTQAYIVSGRPSDKRNRDRNLLPLAKFTGTRADEFPPTGSSINGFPAMATASLGSIAG